MRETLPPAKRLAITMHFLAKGNTYSDTADLFGTSASTVNGILHETISVLKAHFFSRSIKWPEAEELEQVMVDFQNLVGMPQVGGAIDGCFIPLFQPTGIYKDKYWCYKGIYAINLLAVCDANCIFTYVDAGQPGSVGDGASFLRSDLKQGLEKGTVLPMSQYKTIQGPNGLIPVRPFLVGDAAFSLAPYMQKSFTGEPRPHTEEHAFNWCHIRTRRVIENAFGRLKGRCSNTHNTFSIQRHQANSPMY